MRERPEAAVSAACPARLRWQCRRGMLELDVLLQDFLENGYDDLGDEERGVFEALLGYPDSILFEWLMGRQIPLDPVLANVVHYLRHAPHR